MTWYEFFRWKQNISVSQLTSIRENFICLHKQGPFSISARLFSKAKTLKKEFGLSMDFEDNPIYPFWEAHGQAR